MLSGTLQQEANAELKWYPPFPRGAAWTSDYTGWLPSCKGPQFVLEIGRYYGYRFVFVAYNMSAQHQCRWAFRTPNSSLRYLYGVVSDWRKWRSCCSWLAAWKSCVFPCAPLPGDSLPNRLLMVCQRLSYRTSWELTFCEARYCSTRYRICLKSNSIQCFLPHRMHGSVSGLKWDSHHWGLHQLTRWRHFLFLLLCDLEFDGFSRS